MSSINTRSTLVAVACFAIFLLFSYAPEATLPSLQTPASSTRDYPGTSAEEALSRLRFVSIKKTAGGHMCQNVSDRHELDFFAERDGKTWLGTVCKTVNGRYHVESHEFTPPPPNAGPE